MKTRIISRHGWGGLILAGCLAAALPGRALAAPETAERPSGQWVCQGANGKLQYRTTPAGDRIMDFSHAGYMGGGVALPQVPVRRTVRPSGAGDDTAAIQAALDQVAALPLEGGFRGAVLLAPGTFVCERTLSITASGVVLRGSGSAAESPTRSTIRMTGRPHTAIVIRGQAGGGGGRGSRSEAAADRTPDESQPFRAAATTIADAYVPSGSSSFTVRDAAGLAVGDTIEILRPVTEAWIRFMQMHDLVRDGRPQTWLRAGSSIACERRITGLHGSRVTVDVPLSDSFDARYLNPPGSRVVKIRPPDRLSQAGVENLHLESPPQPISHSQPHFTALRINGEDCWARDLVIDETMNSVAVSGRRITLQRVSVNRKALHQGSSRPAEFAPNGSQVLLDRCSVNADNVWFVGTGGGHTGPIVLLNCVFRGNGRAEAHQRWSTGLLYDNCRAPEGGMDFRNRGSMGSGHGWTMGWGVAWNCVAKDFVVQNPPGAVNWLIGCIGSRQTQARPFGAGPHLPEGTVDSHGTPVAPSSLYLAQLAERLGPQAVKNIGY
ncbi:MAG TPA: hypothetical protein PKX23_10120 [Verrucomicrobiota bacterium]|nr:hypothetical protein [Verrucomicrobiota bacterium]